LKKKKKKKEGDAPIPRPYGLGYSSAALRADSKAKEILPFQPNPLLFV